MENKLKWMIATFLAFTLMGFSGCGGSDSRFDNVSPGVDGSVTVVISQRYAWNDKTDTERTEFAKQAVEAGVEAYEKQQADKEYGDLYERDLHTVIGCFDGKAVFFYNTDTVPDVTIDESTIVANIPPEHAIQGVIDIWCMGVEKGVAYFNASLMPTLNWNTSDEQGRIIENVMSYCKVYADNEGAVRFEVICVDKDTQKAFVYNTGNTVQAYVVGTEQFKDYTVKN